MRTWSWSANSIEPCENAWMWRLAWLYTGGKGLSLSFPSGKGLMLWARINIISCLDIIINISDSLSKKLWQLFFLRSNKEMYYMKWPDPWEFLSINTVHIISLDVLIQYWKTFAHDQNIYFIRLVFLFKRHAFKRHWRPRKNITAKIRPKTVKLVYIFSLY